VRRWWPIWLSFSGLLVLAYGIDCFHDFLAARSGSISEISVTVRVPESVWDAYINSRCDFSIGKLDRAMRCRDAIIALRTDY